MSCADEPPSSLLLLGLQNVPASPCFEIGWDCRVTLCAFNDSSQWTNLTSEPLAVCGVYEIFKPKPFFEGDKFFTVRAHTALHAIRYGAIALSRPIHTHYCVPGWQVLEMFPGGGSCAAFHSTIVFHWAALSMSVLGLGIALLMTLFYRVNLQVASLSVMIVVILCALPAVNCAAEKI